MLLIAQHFQVSKDCVWGLLKMFAYTYRYSDLITRFGRGVTELSLMITKTTDIIF